MLIELDVINYPIVLPEEGIEVHEFTPLCLAIENYLKKVRLPDYLHSLKIRINARLVQVGGRTILRLIFLHDGQLPLPFSASKKDRRPAPALLEELQHIKNTICTALVQSNQVWKDAAKIVNELENPGEDVVNFQMTTGFQAPRRPSSKFVPATLTLFAADKQISIQSIETRPEYTETHPQVFTVVIHMNSQGMMFKVKSIQNEDPESDFVSHAHIDQDLRPRWPLGQDLAWHNYAGIGVMLEVPVDLVGFAIVSTETLSAKSIQVHKFDLNGTLIQHLMGFVQKVKSFEATQ